MQRLPDGRVARVKAYPAFRESIRNNLALTEDDPYRGSELRTPRRVLLVEDDARLRSRLAAVLRRRPDLRIVGAVETAEEALVLLRQGLEVDVALVDLRLPGMPGRELIAIA